jgi:aminotransferase
LKTLSNSRIQSLSRSEIRIMTTLCDEIGGINLSQGICDMKLPPCLAERAKAAIDSGKNHYTAHDGIVELRKAVSQKLSHYNSIQADPYTDIVITAGATGAFYSACLALLNPGDEVIIFEPYYGYHEYTLLSLGIEPVYATLSPGTWSFDASEVESLITAHTRGILVNTPANPTGKVFSQRELEQLADICTSNDLLLFTDEIYEYIVYDGLAHISPGSLSALRDRVVTVSGFSKTFSITGWRIGYCACCEELAKPIGFASDLVYVCAPSPLQSGVAGALLELGDDYYLSLQSQYQRKRDLVCNALKEASLWPYIPQGAYYILADVSAVPGRTAKEKAMYILNTTGVAVVPGSSFYHGGGGEDLVRLCFAKEDQVLAEACERLQKLKI